MGLEEEDHKDKYPSYHSVQVLDTTYHHLVNVSDTPFGDSEA